ncbi:hypothetical protein RPMA_09645 [Tardiphaga alba]|uniref:Uncharacterized protein n=1 Tax=Tardiphaga alba TaxID=340268 RepID=A0ABX8A754_9BRAD|nr:hypothetical protein [Tardiphaga alba]QUS39067.1 hypothetical protein RPMA_09645 [Tardiphaga alba]
MVDLDWLTERLCEVLRWHMAKPDRASDPLAPDVPFAGERVWSIFLALNAARTGSGFGPNPITHPEIDAWSRLYREPVWPFELDIIRALDGAFLKASLQKSGQADAPEVNLRPFSLDVFDAVFGA